MLSDFDQEFSPQTSEGITKVCWVNNKEILDRLKNSYSNLKDNLKHE